MHAGRARQRRAHQARGGAAKRVRTRRPQSRDARVEPRQLRRRSTLRSRSCRRSTTSSHGTMICCGARPSTDSEISCGAAPASSDTIAVIADRSASGAEPNSRIRETPSSLTPRSTRLACDAPAQMIGASWLRPATRLTSARPAFVFPLGDRIGRGVGEDHGHGADDGGDVGGAGHHGVIAIDGRRLRDVERLAGRDVGEIVDDDDAADDVDRRELSGQRSANVTGAKDHRRTHGQYSIVLRTFDEGSTIVLRSTRGDMSRVSLDYRRHAWDWLRRSRSAAQGRRQGCDYRHHVRWRRQSGARVVGRRCRRWSALCATCATRRRCSARSRPSSRNSAGSMCS